MPIKSVKMKIVGLISPCNMHRHARYQNLLYLFKTVRPATVNPLPCGIPSGEGKAKEKT